MKRKDIHLHIPRSWNECSTYQLERLSSLSIQRDVNRQLGIPDDTSDRQYRIRAFLVLAGIQDQCRTEFDDDSAIYWFPLRRTSLFKRIFFRKIEVPIRPWEMKQYVDKHLAWLDEPYQRLRSPYADVVVRHHLFFKKRLRCLSDRMTDCTYRQYINLENILKQYWVTQQLASDLQSNGGSPSAIRHQLHNLDQLRRMFISTMLSPSTHIVREEHNGVVLRVNKTTYSFDDAQISLLKDLFSDRQVLRLFPVLLQFYLSVQKYFSTLYPNLYIHRDEGDSMKLPDFIRMEIESMSTIMKYQGFADYRAIYDSDAVHILRVLDNMARESKELKSIQQRPHH